MKKHKKKLKVIPEGTPSARFNWIMDELEKRFPDNNPISSCPPEVRMLAALDYERTVLREAVKLAQVSLDDWARISFPEECNSALVEESRNRVYQFGTMYYIATIQQQLTKALNGNQNQDSDW